MRMLGLVLMAVGFGILTFIIFLYFSNKEQRIISPIPSEEVGIIVITPTKKSN